MQYDEEEVSVGPQVEPVAGDATLPGRSDVVVIGGGIIGVVSALCLAERGLKVSVVEKGETACHSGPGGIARVIAL